MIWAVILSVLLLIYVLKYYYEGYRMPPGPLSLPLVGSLPFLNASGSKGILDPRLGKKYGDIYTVDAAWCRVVVINDFSLAKGLFNRDDLSGRFQGYWHKYVKGYDGISYGLIHSQGPMWQSQRRFALVNLKNLGFGKKSLESVVYEEVYNLFHYLDRDMESNGDILMSETFNIPIVNVLWSIVGSHKFEYDDSKSFIEKLGADLRRGIPVSMFLSIFANVLPSTEADKAMIYMKNLIETLIDDHEKNLNENCPNDFIDLYLIEMRRSGDPNFNKKQLVVICFDLFIAGSETTSTTLLWMMQLMALNQDVQKNCFDEISRVLGNVLPTQEDIKRLPYTMSTIYEIQRVSNTAPASLIHIALRDISVGKYVIPQGTSVVANLSSMHMDSRTFYNPNEFNPMRFYEGKNLDQLVPFGFGRRVCMGISLAKKELFYFVVMIIKTYKISLAVRHPRPDPTKFDMGITSVPLPFYVNLKKRH